MNQANREMRKRLPGRDVQIFMYQHTCLSGSRGAVFPICGKRRWRSCVPSLRGNKCFRGQRESSLLCEAFLALGPSHFLWAKLLSFKIELRSLYISAVKTCHIWFLSSRNVAILCPTVAFNLAIQVYIDTGLGIRACIIINEKIYLTSSLVGHFKFFFVFFFLAN